MAQRLCAVLRQHPQVETGVIEQQLKATLQAGVSEAPGISKEPELISALNHLQGQIQHLRDLLQKHTLPEVPDFCRGISSSEFVREAVAYAHKLCFTTFAPAGYPETPLRHFRPPAPQEWQMHASQLHAFASRCPCCNFLNKCTCHFICPHSSHVV